MVQIRAQAVEKNNRAESHSEDLLLFMHPNSLVFAG
jgi:hypothetical protein